MRKPPKTRTDQHHMLSRHTEAAEQRSTQLTWTSLADEPAADPDLLAERPALIETCRVIVRRERRAPARS